MQGRLALVLAATLLSSCGSGDLRLGVILRTDFMASEVYRVVTEVRVAETDATLRESVFNVSPELDLSADSRVAEHTLPPGNYEVTVLLEGPDATRRQVASVTLTASFDVTIVVSRTCDGVTCPEPGGNPALVGCLAGRCVDPACVAGGEGCETPCALDADCVDNDGLDCVVARCVSGTCDAVADDSRCAGDATCHATRGCELTTCGSSETECGNGLDDDCDGAVDCLDDECSGSACDDGDDCTHGDTCGASGCAGTPITCESDECVERTCDGTDACAVGNATAGTSCGDDGNPCTADACDGAGACGHAPVPSGTACPDDGEACTRDECNAGGTCTHPALPNGTDPGGGEFELCCNGSTTDLTTRSNCGGCGVVCPSGNPCHVFGFDGFPEHPSCDCPESSPACPGSQACNPFLRLCTCGSAEPCPAGQRCVMQPLPPTSNTHNYCWY